MKKYSLCILALGFLFINCNKNDDDFQEPGGVDPDPEANVTAQDFIWKATNLWYFWQQDVPNLADDRFPTSVEYTEFLQSESDPGDFFDTKLRFRDDRFTFYSEDYRELTQSLSGISSNNGVDFGLSLFSDNDEEVYGYVYYIMPNSDASTKDIQRGDIFTGVDGQTLNTSNYLDLLYGDNASYTLNMATLADNVITPNGKEVQLTKQANFQENPILVEKIIETNGKKIGYLVYNSFLNAFDSDVNDVFTRFKAANITDLVLDLRYNPGGRVSSAQAIASMIYTNDTENVFSTSIYNDKLTGFYKEEDVDLNSYFPKNITNDDNEVLGEISSLNLDKVYIIALYSSASASELMINSLAPYMDVIHVGDTTRGKNEFSVTLVDNPNGGYIYRPESVNEINPDNSWAIQPLIGRSSNADGFFQYTNGLLPDIPQEEELSDFGILGDPQEPLLARAIQEITGVAAKRSFVRVKPVNEFTNRKMFLPAKDKMFVQDVVIPTLKE